MTDYETTAVEAPPDELMEQRKKKENPPVATGGQS